MQTLTDVLLALFLALGGAWFAVDLVRKLRPAPAEGIGPRHVVIAAPVAATIAPGRDEAKVSPRAGQGDVPADHLVAIAASVHHVFKGRARLLCAVAAGAAPSAGNPGAASQVDWAREGRRDIFTSHRVR